MIRSIRKSIVLLLVLGVAAGTGACAKKTAETTAAPPATASVSVTDVDLGRAIGADKRVTDKTTDFKPTDTIYAVVLTSGTSSNANLKARWTYQDGQVVNESDQSIAPTGDTATEFHISKPDGWPKGKYKVEVLLDGASARTKDFEVK